MLRKPRLRQENGFLMKKTRITRSTLRAKQTAIKVYYVLLILV